MTRPTLLRELAAAALVAGVGAGPAAAQRCPYLWQMQHQRQTQMQQGYQQQLYRQQMQAEVQQRMQQMQEMRQQQFLERQQQQEARVLMQQQARMTTQRQRQQQQLEQALRRQQEQRRQMQLVMIRREKITQHVLARPGRGPGVHRLPVAHRFVGRRVTINITAIRREEQQILRQERLVREQERVTWQRFQHARRQVTHRELARPRLDTALLRREEVQQRLVQRRRQTVEVRRTPPRVKINDFFRIKGTCGSCHWRCAPQAPGLIARQPSEPPPEVIGRPQGPLPRVLDRPGQPLVAIRRPALPNLPQGLPRNPGLPQGLPGPRPGLPTFIGQPGGPPSLLVWSPPRVGPGLPVGLAGPGQPGLPVGMTNPGSSPLPLGPLGLGKSPRAPGDTSLPMGFAQQAPSRRSPGETDAAPKDGLLAGLARPPAGPDLATPDLLQLLPVERGTAAAPPEPPVEGIRLGDTFTLRSRPGPALAAPPSGELPETVLRLPDVPAADAGGQAAPDDAFTGSGPSDVSGPPLPDTVLPAQPVT